MVIIVAHNKHTHTHKFAMAQVENSAEESEREDEGIHGIDWQDLLRGTGGEFDVDLLRRHYNIYGMQSGTPFTAPSRVNGLREWFQTHMRALHMKTSNATSNEIRYKWLCQHYFVEERANADPNNYHVFPF